MIEITLSQGQTALIDDADHDLSRMKWYPMIHFGRLYAITVDTGKQESLHRIVASRKYDRPLVKSDRVHFENGNPLDCRRGNISINPAGVTWDAVKKKYKAQRHRGGKNHFLGYHETVEEAQEAARQFDKDTPTS